MDVGRKTKMKLNKVLSSKVINVLDMKYLLLKPQNFPFLGLILDSFKQFAAQREKEYEV